MKLSEMSTRQLAGALCRLTPPMGRIAADEELSGVFTRLKNEMRENEHMTTAQKAAILLETVPVLLETHYEDTIAIIAVMTDRTAAEVDALNGYEMIGELRGCIDSRFIDFFKSSAAMAQTAMVKGE